MNFDLTGQRFNRLTVLGPAKRPEHLVVKRNYWLCACVCGTTKIVATGNLRSGNSQSCGCLHKEIAQAANTTHGHKGTVEYNCWVAMHQRCYNSRTKRYKYYGGKGIVVCDRWSKFENFFADMGVCPAGLSIDRKDNNGNYTPENCRWATDSQQAQNSSRAKPLQYMGKQITIAEAATLLKMPIRSVRRRQEYGWSDEKIMENPKGWSRYDK